MVASSLRRFLRRLPGQPPRPWRWRPWWRPRGFCATTGRRPASTFGDLRVVDPGLPAVSVHSSPSAKGGTRDPGADPVLARDHTLPLVMACRLDRSTWRLGAFQRAVPRRPQNCTTCCAWRLAAGRVVVDYRRRRGVPACSPARRSHPRRRRGGYFDRGRNRDHAWPRSAGGVRAASRHHAGRPPGRCRWRGARRRPLRAAGSAPPPVRIGRHAFVGDRRLAAGSCAPERVCRATWSHLTGDGALVAHHCVLAVPPHLYPGGQGERLPPREARCAPPTGRAVCFQVFRRTAGMP